MSIDQQEQIFKRQSPLKLALIISLGNRFQHVGKPGFISLKVVSEENPFLRRESAENVYV